MPRKYWLYKECELCGNTFRTKKLGQETCSKSCAMKLFKKRELISNEKKGIVQVWACGGGVQSTTIAALICLGKLPKPDYSCIIDSGYEKSSTLEYCKKILIPKLLDIGVTLHIVKTIDYCNNDLFGTHGSMKLPLYLKGNGTIKKLKTRCSDTWKTRVLRKWLRNNGIKRCNTWLGISLDEKRRMRKSGLQWNQNAYPLIDMGITREECINIVISSGWPPPKHTSCYLCPDQNDLQWKTLKENYPDDFEKAIQNEIKIQTINPNMFLHRSCRPLSKIDFDPYKSEGFVVGDKTWRGGRVKS